MTSFAHIINPVGHRNKSELMIVQPVTFASIEKALEKTSDVEVFCTHYKYDRMELPGWIKETPNLKLSSNMFTDPLFKPKLPLIREILQRLYDASTADYMIYTNVDICLQPHFYNEVRRFAESGLDAFIINRRTIPGHYNSPDQLPEMYMEQGKRHVGFDCFVFKRSMFPKFYLANICIGCRGIGSALCRNMERFSLGFKVFKEEFLTFHIGNRKKWKKFTRGNKYNMDEYHKIIKQLRNVEYASPGDGDR